MLFNTQKGYSLEGHTVVLDIEAIQRILPHRYPFLMIDRVLEIEAGKRVVGIKNVSANEPFFQGHYPGQPVMPGVLIVEALAQTAAILMGYEETAGDRVPLFMGIDRARFRRRVVPGDQLRLEVEVIQRRRNIMKAEGRAFVGDDLAADAVLMATAVERSKING